MAFFLSHLESTTQAPAIDLQPIKGVVQKDDSKSSSKVLMIFVLSIILLAFFLLIALSIYNLLMK